MTATHNTNGTASSAPVLYLALDLGASNWKLAFSVGLGQKPRIKTITARSTLSLVFEIKAAKKRFGLPEDAPVVCWTVRRLALYDGPRACTQHDSELQCL